MELSQSERIALGIARNDGNHAPMTKREYKNIRKTLKLSQEGMGILLGCDRRWIMTCEKDGSKISYAHSHHKQHVINGYLFQRKVNKVDIVTCPKSKKKLKQKTVVLKWKDTYCEY